ncbi:MAG TPA: hypothetical protein VGP27_18615, partial [Mycobacterium sp.]|nr:hypothetical protein [Mycobacterium sp.]
MYHTSRSCGAGEVATEHIEVNSLIEHDRAQLTFDPFHPMRASARPRPASAASVVMTLSLAIAVGVLLLVFYRPLESTAQGVAARSGISRLV